MSNRGVLAAGVIGWVTIALALLVIASPLGHDESQYVIAASDFLAGRPPRWLYLSQGTTALAIPGVLAGGSEIALRSVMLVLGLGFLAAAYGLARSLVSPVTAAWLACVLAASLGIVRRSTDLLSDMPAAAALLAGTALLVGELLRDDGPRRRIVWTGALFAAALYLRYGSALAIAIIGVVAAIGGWRGVARRPLLVVATLGAFVALLAPHMIAAYARTGSPVGIITLSTDEIRTVSDPGLVDYFTHDPTQWYGIVATPLLVLGLASIAWLRERRFVMLWVMAIGCVIGLGLTALAQPRYIYYSQVVLVMLGIEVVRRLVEHRRAVVIACAIVVALSWALAVSSSIRGARKPSPAQFVVAAARAIDRDAAGAPCAVLGTEVQLHWYSRCKPVQDVYREEIGPGKPRTYVVFTPAVYPLDRSALPGKQVVLLEERGMTLLRVDP